MSKPSQQDWIDYDRGVRGNVAARISVYVMSLASADTSKTYVEHFAAARREALDDRHSNSSPSRKPTTTDTRKLRAAIETLIVAARGRAGDCSRPLSVAEHAAVRTISDDRLARWTTGQCAPNRFVVAFRRGDVAAMEREVASILRGPVAPQDFGGGEAA